MKRALITGSHGFVGQNFSRRLTRDGWQLTLVDDLSAGNASANLGEENTVFHWGDLRGFVRYADPNKFDLIIHCAAVVGGRLKIDGDPLAVATDLAIDSDFFNWVVKAKNKPKVVYFSSSAVYPTELQGQKHHVDLAESLVSQGTTRFGRPDMSYGWAKLTGEYLAHLAVQQYGADVVIYRPFSGYGEDQSFDYPFPSIIRRVGNREDPITIWGSGDQCRDFIHIDDVVEAVMQTKDVLKPGDVLNLGSGEATSFRQLVEAARLQIAPASWPPTVKCDTTKPEGVFYRVADTYKLNQFYKPKVSLEEGIRRVAAYLKERINA